MPIIPGVDGVLLELLLVTPRVGGDGLFAHGHPNHAAPEASTALRGGKHKNPDSLAQQDAEDANYCYSPGIPFRGGQAGEAGYEEEEEEDDDLTRGFCDSSSVSNPIGTGRVSAGGVSSEKVDVRVGAVAMLLSEVAADNWRTMESPLFDGRAGSVVGKIKMLARRGGMKEGETATANKPTSAVCMEVEGTTATDKPKKAATTTTGVGAEAAAATAAGPSAVTGVAAASPPLMELMEGSLSGGQEDQSRARRKPGSATTSASATTRCIDGRGDNNIPSTSHDASRTCGELSDRSTGGPAGTVELPVAAVGLAVAAAAAAAATAAAAANDAPPRATILYRGLCLPFRWFRSSSPAAMDKALRETLGEFVGGRRRLIQHKERGRARWACCSRSCFLFWCCFRNDLVGVLTSSNTQTVLTFPKRVDIVLMHHTHKQFKPTWFFVFLVAYSALPPQAAYL